MASAMASTETRSEGSSPTRVRRTMPAASVPAAHRCRPHSRRGLTLSLRSSRRSAGRRPGSLGPDGRRVETRGGCPTMSGFFRAQDRQSGTVSSPSEICGPARTGARTSVARWPGGERRRVAAPVEWRRFGKAPRVHWSGCIHTTQSPSSNGVREEKGVPSPSRVQRHGGSCSITLATASPVRSLPAEPPCGGRRRGQHR